MEDPLPSPKKVVLFVLEGAGWDFSCCSGSWNPQQSHQLEGSAGSEKCDSSQQCECCSHLKAK